MRLTRWVVPDRGRPTTMMGGPMSIAAISGWRVSASLMRNRFDA